MKTGIYKRMKWTLDNGVLLLGPSDKFNDSKEFLDDSDKKAVHSIKTKGKISFEGNELVNLFELMPYLKTADLSGFDTSRATSMYGMFFDCKSLTSLDLSNFDTHNVQDMSGVFYNCQNLTKLDLSNFDTSNVTNMIAMFCQCEKLTELDLSNFNTSKLAIARNMFSKCYSLTNLDLSNFDTRNVTDMEAMFSRCFRLKNVNLSSFDTSNVEDMSAMFSNCSSLESIDLSSFNTKCVGTYNDMFYMCANLESLDLSNFDFSLGRCAQDMFEGCSSLKEIKFPSVNSSGTSFRFEHCTALTKFVFPEIEIFVKTENNKSHIAFNQKMESDAIIAKLLEHLYIGLGIINWKKKFKFLNFITNGRLKVSDYERKVLLKQKYDCRSSNFLSSVAFHFLREIRANYPLIEEIKNIDKIIMNATHNEISAVNTMTKTELKESGALSDIDAYFNGVPLEDILT